MSKKRYRAEEIIGKPREADILINQRSSPGIKMGLRR
jgi:hypothetical protein